MDLEEPRQPNKYHTYEKHRKFLMDKLEEKTDKWYDARKDVEEELLPALSKRIQYLIDDIVLLDSAGYLSSEYWNQGWESMLNIQPRIEFERETELEVPRLWIPNTRIEEEVKLGYSIGKMLRLISSGLGKEVDHNGLGWGFILGFLGEPRSRFDVEKSRVLDLLDHVHDKIEWKQKWVHSMPITMIRESIEEEATRPYELKEKVSWNIADVGRQARSNYKHSSTGTEIPTELLLINTIIESSSEKLNQLVSLAENIRHDVNLMEESHHRGLEATDAFYEVWNSDSGATRNTIKVECNVYKGLVSKIMNDIGDDPSASKWEDRPPLVEDISSSDTGGEWKVTDYGKLIGICLYEENGLKRVFRAIAQEMTREHARSNLTRQINGSLEDLSVPGE